MTSVDWDSLKPEAAVAVARKILEPPRDSYFRCPLAMLRYGQNDRPAAPKERMQMILDYCIKDVGDKMLAKLGSVDNAKFIMHSLFGVRQTTTEERNSIFLGLRALGVKVSDPLKIECKYVDARGWLANYWVAKNERNATFTAPADVFWACYNQLWGMHESNFLEWDEFRVLMAIGSKLGDKQFGKCGWREIQCRADGRLRKYSGGPGATPTLTRGQIRDLVDSLWLQGRLRRISKRGEAFYGVGLSEEEMIKRIIDDKQKKAALRHQRQASNQSALDVIKSAFSS
jgi:hypothetical protein